MLTRSFIAFAVTVSAALTACSGSIEQVPTLAGGANSTDAAKPAAPTDAGSTTTTSSDSAAKDDSNSNSSGNSSGGGPIGGGDRDGHGCIGSAGYAWCAKENKCERPWDLAMEKGFPNTAEDFASYCGGS